VGNLQKVQSQRGEYKDDSKFDKPSSQVSKEDEYFSYLEMERTTDFDTIKKQYRKMMKKYHPDKFEGNDKQKKIAEQITRQLNEAYDYFEREYEKPGK